MSTPLAMTARATLFLVLGGAAEACASRAAAQVQPEAAAREVLLQPPHEQPAVQEQVRTVVSARRLIGLQAHDATGARIGTIRDILFRPDGGASAIVVSAGTFFALGRTHYRIPWEALEFPSESRRVDASVETADLQAFAWTRRAEAKHEEEVRARQVIRSRAFLRDGARYGRVRDVVFRINGRLDGLVIAPAHKLGDRRGDRRAHFYDERFEVEPRSGRITLPHSADTP